jgi:hypothetical protein
MIHACTMTPAGRTVSVKLTAMDIGAAAQAAGVVPTVRLTRARSTCVNTVLVTETNSAHALTGGLVSSATV